MMKNDDQSVVKWLAKNVNKYDKIVYNDIDILRGKVAEDIERFIGDQNFRSQLNCTSWQTDGLLFVTIGTDLRVPAKLPQFAFEICSCGGLSSAHTQRRFLRLNLFVPCPESLDVDIDSNLFGDILSDLGSAYDYRWAFAPAPILILKCENYPWTN